MDLLDIRNRIDAIDDKLLPLFLERMSLSKEVAEYKKANNLPILNRTREREILKSVAEKSGDLEQFAHRLYTTIFELSRAYQDTLCTQGASLSEEISKALENTYSAFPKTGVVACFGTEGANAQLAADKMFPRGELVFFKTFEGVFDAVENGLCEFGIIPFENSSNGSVRETYELLLKKNVHIVRSERLCIRHELLAKKGARIEDIKEIYSHPQAIGQCSRFLKELGSKVKITPCESTAQAAQYAANSKNNSIAAIASHANAEIYNLASIATSIQDSDNNYTRFICITKTPKLYPGANRISLILACQHKPGALYEVLAKFAALEINLLKIESYPILGHDFEFMFFFELSADITDEKTVSMLESLNGSCETFKFLGNYEEVL